MYVCMKYKYMYTYHINMWYIYIFICLFDMIFNHGSANNIVIIKLLSQICLGELAQRSLATSGCDNSLTEFRHEEVVSDWNLWKNQGLN